MSDRRIEILKSCVVSGAVINGEVCGDISEVTSAMDVYMKECCLELLEYMAEKEYKCFWIEDDNGNPRYFFSKGARFENLTKEQLFENFL
jgi:hypothetical protein